MLSPLILLKISSYHITMICNLENFIIYKSRKYLFFSITDEKTGIHHIYSLLELEIHSYKKGPNLIASLIKSY